VEWNKQDGLAMSCLVDVFQYAEGQYAEYMFDRTVAEQWLVNFLSATNHSLLEKWIDLNNAPSTWHSVELYTVIIRPLSIVPLGSRPG
jgi:hypothetical protein